MIQLSFSTTGGWSMVNGFGCASLGLPGVCDNGENTIRTYPIVLEGVCFTGSYGKILEQISTLDDKECVHAAIVLFGNAGGENAFLRQLQKFVSCPMVGGGAAIDPVNGKSALITGGGEAAVFLITDDRFKYEVKTQCIHDTILEQCCLTLSDPRTILTINGEDAAAYLARKKAECCIAETDFEHLTLSDLRNVNAHLSNVNGVIKSGRDLDETMLLRFVAHEKVYEAMRSFYDDPDAVVFGCAGLSGLLDRPLETDSLGLFLFGEVCTVDGVAEFGNLMLSKLIIKEN